MNIGQPKGSKHYCAKLNDTDVNKIKLLFSLGFDRYSDHVLISKLWNVSYNCIYDISKGRTWRT